jgi:hypothetical protein
MMMVGLVRQIRMRASAGAHRFKACLTIEAAKGSKLRWSPMIGRLDKLYARQGLIEKIIELQRLARAIYSLSPVSGESMIIPQITLLQGISGRPRPLGVTELP